jgi:hypothetical protein
MTEQNQNDVKRDEALRDRTAVRDETLRDEAAAVRGRRGSRTSSLSG